MASGPARRRYAGCIRQLAHPGELAARQGARARLHARRRLILRELAVEDGAELAHADRLRRRARERPAGPRRRDFLQRAGGEHGIHPPVDALLERAAVVVGNQSEEPVRDTAPPAPTARPAPPLAPLSSSDSSARITRRALRTSTRAARSGARRLELGDQRVGVSAPALLEGAPPSLVGRAAEREVAENSAQVEAGAAFDDHWSSGVEQTVHGLVRPGRRIRRHCTPPAATPIRRGGTWPGGVRPRRAGW